MIPVLYERFQDWCKNGSVYIISDTHFDDDDCIKMDPNWMNPEDAIAIIKKTVHKCDTLIHLGDVGNLEYMKQIKGHKVLIMGNHDTGVTKYKEVFDKVLDAILASEEHSSNEITIAGKDKLIDYPEFNDVTKLKKTVSALEKNEKIIPIMSAGDDVELSINFCDDESGLEDCSVVTISCNIQGKPKITAGVIGPMRMDYPKAISVLKEVAETIENSLKEGDY